MDEALQTTTTFSFDGYRIAEYKGVVRGLVVRSPTLGQGFLGGLKQIVGGQIGAYAEMCEQARQQAYDLLLEHARALQANAIVGLRYESSEVGSACLSSARRAPEGTILTPILLDAVFQVADHLRLT